AMHVLAAIAGPDDGDGIAAPLAFDPTAPIRGLRVGFDPGWFEKAEAEPDRKILEVLKKLGLELVEIKLPTLPYDALFVILMAEAGAAFEELVLTRGVDALAEQHKDAWPTGLRDARFISSVDYVQADRLRRRTMQIMHDVFARVDLLAGPAYAGDMLVIT